MWSTNTRVTRAFGDMGQTEFGPNLCPKGTHAGQHFKHGLFGRLNDTCHLPLLYTFIHLRMQISGTFMLFAQVCSSMGRATAAGYTSKLHGVSTTHWQQQSARCAQDGGDHVALQERGWRGASWRRLTFQPGPVAGTDSSLRWAHG